jgi:hypothetical protein
MDANVETDMKRAMSSGGTNRATVAYLEARLASVKSQLVVANEATYRQVQGRALELQDLIKFIQLSREP